MGKQPSSKSRPPDSEGGGGSWDKIRTPPEPSLWDHFGENPEGGSLEGESPEVEPEPPPPEPAETDSEPSRGRRRRRYKMRTIEDVINSSERVFNDFQQDLVTKDEVEAFTKVANVIVNAKKAEAQIGGDKPEPLDLTKIAAKPDLETMRPLFVEARNFGDMTEEERRELFERTQKRGTNGSGNGNGS